MDPKNNAFYEAHRERDDLVYFRAQADYAYHFHSNVEIDYVLNDGAEISVNGVTKKLSRGEYIFADSFDVHSNLNADLLVIIISEKYLNDFVKHKNGRVLKNNFFYDKDGKILSILNEFFNAENKSELYISGLVNILLDSVLTNAELVEGKSMQDSPLIREIVKYLNENYQQNVTLDTLSKKFGYNKYYISHALNEYLSSNLSSYLNKIRLNRFLELMKSSTPDKIITNAFECGFDSLQSFYRNFKTVYGTTPLKYLKNKIKKIL